MTTSGGTDLMQVLAQGRRQLLSPPVAADWLAELRERGAENAAAMPLPDRAQEAWRYTPVGFLDQVSYAVQPPGPVGALQLSDIDELLLAEVAGPRLVFVNGHFAPGLSSALNGAGDVRVATLGGSLGEVPAVLRGHLDRIAEHRHVFAALNSALMADGALIHVPANATGEAQVEILHVSVGLDEPAIAHPRHLIVLDAGARAHLIERYAALSDTAVYFNNALVEVALGAGSELIHDRLQEESGASQHLSDLHVRLGAGARYRLVQGALGGAWSRTDVRVVFDGEGGEALLDGLLLARDRQLNDVHLDIRHDVPNCTSRETFKSILDGRGRVVFDGRVRVARDAQKTDAMLTNHNLMLSRAAEVDTKPQLEIYADDVKCSHGTTVGELDHAMLFYLRSRGIPQDRARQMLCHGFAGEVLEAVGNAPLRARATALLARRLTEAV